MNVGVHSAGARLSSHGPGGCKSRYLHRQPLPQGLSSNPFQKGLASSSKAPFHKGPTLTSNRIDGFRRAAHAYPAFPMVIKE
jgi:hypothetical protein